MPAVPARLVDRRTLLGGATFGVRSPRRDLFGSGSTSAVRLRRLLREGRFAGVSETWRRDVERVRREGSEGGGRSASASSGEKVPGIAASWRVPRRLGVASAGGGDCGGACEAEGMRDDRRMRGEVSGMDSSSSGGGDSGGRLFARVRRAGTSSSSLTIWRGGGILTELMDDCRAGSWNGLPEGTRRGAKTGDPGGSEWANRGGPANGLAGRGDAGRSPFEIMDFGRMGDGAAIGGINAGEGSTAGGMNSSSKSSMSIVSVVAISSLAGWNPLVISRLARSFSIATISDSMWSTRRCARGSIEMNCRIMSRRR